MKDVEFIQKINAFKKTGGSAIIHPNDSFYEFDNKFMDKVIACIQKKVILVNIGMDEFNPLEKFAINILGNSF